MEQQPIKTISISGVEVKVSPMVEPNWYEYDPTSEKDYDNYREAKQAFEASFYPMENPQVVIDVMPDDFYPPGNEFVKSNGKYVYYKDGYYPAPDGLTFTVKHLCPNEDSFCEVCNCKQVATVKFTPAEKPDLITKWKNVIDMGASSYSWSVLAEMFNDFQQEITTLRARIAELEKKQ